MVLGWWYQGSPLPGTSVPKALELQRLAMTFKGPNGLVTALVCSRQDPRRCGCEVHHVGGAQVRVKLGQVPSCSPKIILSFLYWKANKT